MAFINCTLIVQAINFFIAFFLIKYFLFKPVLAVINQEDAHQESLINTVQAHRAIVAQKEQDLSIQWHSAQEYFEENIPLIAKEQFFSTKSEIIKPEFDKQLIEDMAKQAAGQLIKKVNHVR